MLKLDTEININIPGFFHWWAGELRALLPGKVKQVFDESHSFLIVEPDDNQLTIKLMTSEKTSLIGKYELYEFGNKQFQVLLNEKPTIANAKVVVRLPNQLAAVKQIYIPEAAAENLKQVIGYELDRYTPFTAEQVVFDFIVLEKDKINNQLKILLIFVPKKNFASVLEQITDWGLKPSCVDCEQEPSISENFHERYNLLAEGKRYKKDNKPKIVMVAAMVAMVLLFVAVLVVPLWMESKTVEVLREESRKVEKQAHKVNAIKQRIETLFEESNAIISKKSNEPSLVQTLELLSNLIKDDTWLIHLKYNNKMLHIRGLSPSASSLIGSLEKTPLFNNTHFVSPVTQDKKSGLERFQIATHVVAARNYND